MRQLAPLGVLATNQSMRKFDQHLPHFRIARFNQAGIGLSRAAAGIARCHATETGELLAIVKAIETADFGTKRDSCN